MQGIRWLIYRTNQTTCARSVCCSLFSPLGCTGSHDSINKAINARILWIVDILVAQRFCCLTRCASCPPCTLRISNHKF